MVAAIRPGVLVTMVAASLLAACTVVDVRPVIRAQHDVKHVCIEENDRVLMSGFLPWLRQSFADHGITTEVYTGRPADHCEYTATYVAYWNWDMSMYLHQANVQLRKGGETVGVANFHLRAKGGLALNKWASVESKMGPVMDQMLAEFRSGRQPAPLATPTPAPAGDPGQASPRDP